MKGKTINWNTVWRAAIHVPLGVLAILAIKPCPCGAVIFSLGFFLYEVVQDWRKQDKAYKDLIGFLIGAGAVLVYMLFK